MALTELAIRILSWHIWHRHTSTILPGMNSMVNSAPHMQEQWDSSYLDPVCVDIAAFSELSRRHGWTSSINLWHRTCLLACLGVDLQKMIYMITERNLKFWVKASITMEKLKYLHDVLGMKRPVLAKVCSTHPRILDYSLENTIKSRAAFFCEYFRIEPASLGVICSKHPRMLWVRSRPPQAL